ncbi:hypothetical protein Vretimale_17112 [Volvox reticuliferus]|uniref:Uncharacterized protein n=1 Tax=Volvox reticuliferus TaxID=1737510 RepID=A0A8J4GUB7_9CHLO|nr:hypothetical protein Vretifemale_18627 [Volvox reticuliferus]GIM14081.1 hypothetical protein Vretimale_17112 [Volvox reticuliferus]
MLPSMTSIATDGLAMAWTKPEPWSDQEEALFSSPTCIIAGPSLTSSPSDACTSSNISYTCSCSSTSIHSEAPKVASTHGEQECPSHAYRICFGSPASQGTWVLDNGGVQDHAGSVETHPNLLHSSTLQRNARSVQPLTQSKDGRMVLAWRYTGRHGKPFSGPCGVPLAANRGGTGVAALQRNSNTANGYGWRRCCRAPSGRGAVKAITGVCSALRTVTGSRSTVDSTATSASNKAESVVPKDMRTGSTVRKASASRGDNARHVSSTAADGCCTVTNVFAAGNMAGRMEPGGGTLTESIDVKPLSASAPSAGDSVVALVEPFAVVDISAADSTLIAEAEGADSTFATEPLEEEASVTAGPVVADSGNLMADLPVVDSTLVVMLQGTNSGPAAQPSALEASPRVAASCGFRVRSAHGRVARVVEVYENLSRTATARSVSVKRRP